MGIHYHCYDCGKPESHGSAESGSILSECICENKRVECDTCGHRFLHKDMSMNNMFLALCKLCNEYEPHLMDNVAVGRFKESDRATAILCVQVIGDKLQLTMRAYHLGVTIVFPGMTKEELISRWIMEHPGFHEAMEADFLFNAAILRLKDEYISQAEIIKYRRQLIEEAKASNQVSAAVIT